MFKILILTLFLLALRVVVQYDPYLTPQQELTRQMVRTIVFALLLGLLSQAHGVLLLDTPTPNQIRNNGTNDFSGLIGYTFSLDPGTYTLNSLMFWDGPNISESIADAGDGLIDGVTVFLFETDTMQLLETASFGVGDSATVGNFVSSPASVPLTGGVDYTLVAEVDAGENSFFNQGGIASPFIESSLGSSLVSAFGPSNDDNFPNRVGNDNAANFGPNADIVQVPEPGSWALLSLLGLAAAGRRWKRSLT